MRGHRRRRATPRSPRNPHPPGGLRRDGPAFFVALLANEPGIDSSSLREIGAIALATNVTVFMNRGTKALPDSAAQTINSPGVLPCGA